MSNKDQNTPPPSIFKKSIEDKIISIEKEGEEKKPKQIQIDEINLNEISNDTITNILNNNSVLELFPDINLAMDIVTSSIISPKDLMSTNLNYRLEDSILSIATSQQLLTEVEDHINLFYHLEENLETIVKESLYTKGAYIEAIIPESTLTETIKNGTIGLEEYVGDISNQDKNKVLARKNEMPKKETGNFKTNIGLLEESLDVDDLLLFTDNIEVLKVPSTFKKLKKDAISKKLIISLESSEEIPEDTASVINTAFRKLKEKHVVNILQMNSEAENNIVSKSMPLIMKLPVESVIPIHVVGDPSDHLGYFVMLDESGSPIISSSDWFSGSDAQVADLYKTTLIGKINKELSNKVTKAPILSNLNDIYGNIIDKRIKNALNSSDELKDIADISEVRHIYRVMLTRVLSNQKTRLLFLPADLVQFYAFEYRENGTGLSLLEKISLLASFRAILLFGKMMSSIKNSIPTTKVSVVLDENDPDPAKTKERIISETLKNRQIELPVGLLNVHDLTQWVHKVGYLYEFEHSDLPNIKIDLSDVNRSITATDDELEEDIRNRILMTLGVTPEIVEAGVTVDFAATILTNNALLARRTQKRQITLQKHITNHCKKIIKCDAVLRSKIQSIVLNDLSEIKKGLKEFLNDVEASDSYIIDLVTNDIIENLKIKLPGIEVTSEDGLADSFEKYKNNLETAIDSVLGNEALSPELAAEFGNRTEEYKNMVFHTLLRKWMRDNNFMPDLNKLTTTDTSGDLEFNAFKEHEEYLEKIILAMKPILKDNKKIKGIIQKIYEKYDAEEEEELEETSTEETPNDESTTEETPNDESTTDESTTEETSTDKDEEPDF